jgi:hypothetical protein
MEKQYFISSTYGSLHDTRTPKWSENPLRENYYRHHSIIKTIADLKATLRAGSFAWPGGYPLYFITQDGAALSFKTVREEWRQVVWDWLVGASTGWRVIACGVNWEDGNLYCEHSNEKIESAYCE